MDESDTLPAFLRQSRSDVQNKFIDLEWQQRHRIAAGTNPPTHNQRDESPWSRLDAAQDAEVTRRNRYFNVEPWAANRVRLKTAFGGSDYINASPITLKQTVSAIEKHFIATQGPKPETAAQMLHMVAAETGAPTTPAVVVMLTQTHEGGKEKCVQYFPGEMQQPIVDFVEPAQDGHSFQARLELKRSTEDKVTRSTIRELELRWSFPTLTTDKSPSQTFQKSIYHLLFSGWPDFSVPDGPDREALLQLIALSAQLNNNNNNSQSNGLQAAPPLVVHCSAGVGRTGTFIALSYLLQEIAEGAWDDVAMFNYAASYIASDVQTLVDDQPGAYTNGHGPNSGGATPVGAGGGARDSMVLTDAGRGYDPIFETVDALRKQRMMMVQGEAQFALLYDVCREAWLERQHAGHMARRPR